MVLNLDFHLKKPKEAYETCISAFSDTTLGEPTKLEYVNLSVNKYYGPKYTMAHYRLINTTAQKG